MSRIYLDHASTTPMDERVMKAMEPYFSKKFGNPGAMHRFGQEAQAATDDSRQKIADFFACKFDEIIFTGSATESNNLAIRGAVKSIRDLTPHIITTAIEHKSVLETCRELEKFGQAEVSYLSVNQSGFVRPEDVEKAIRKNTVLVSIGYVNSEIGAIQPLTEIARAMRISGRNTPLFHTDAVQALNYLDCNAEKLGVDLLTFSGHKIYGPKGIGGLYVKKGTPFAPIITGGNQEFGLRSGTENTPYIVGFAKSIEIVEKLRAKESARLVKLRDYFIDQVLEKIHIAELNGSRKDRVANNANFLFRGVDANKLLIALDQANISGSAGSTCTIKTVTPSEVLLAIGCNEAEAKQSVRFTLGRGTTKQKIDKTISTLYNVIRKYIANAEEDCVERKKDHR